MNVAITDPLQQAGLLAFDDEELLKAAHTFHLSTSNVSQVQGNVFVVAFSQNCSGMSRICYQQSKCRVQH
jgi:hypothetical protein